MQVKKQQLELEMEQQTFKIGERVHQSCILSYCLFNVHAEYIMLNAWRNEPQVGIKIAERIINNLRSADDNTLMAEKKKELNSFLMNAKEESENVHLKLNIKKKKQKQKTKFMVSSLVLLIQLTEPIILLFTLSSLFTEPG